MDISFSSILAWFKDCITAVLTWISDFFAWTFDYGASLILNLAILVIDTIFDCCSALAANVVAGYQAIMGHASGVGYFLDMANVYYGLQLLVCAYTVRFILRRIWFLN